MARLAALDPARLTPEQEPVYAQIAAHHAGHVRGPWAALLGVPEVDRDVHALYERLGPRSKLGQRLYELVTLVVAARWGAAFAWNTHEKKARAEGIPGAAVDAIRDGRTPSFERDDERAVYAFVDELIETKRIADATYARARDVLGEAGVVELVALTGLYALVMMTLNAFEVAG